MASCTRVNSESGERSSTVTPNSSKSSLKTSDIDEILQAAIKRDNRCDFGKCKSSITNFAITCKHCHGRYCTTHGLPEIHGCGEAAKRDEKRKFLHPQPKLSQVEHIDVAGKLAARLKQMQFERKSKQFSNKGKK